MLNVHLHNLATETSSDYRTRVKLVHDLMKLNHPSVNPVVSSGFVSGADVVVFNKHFDPEGMSQLVFLNKRQKAKIVYDITEDHFDEPIGKFYEWMCKQSDRITCSTPNLQERIYEVTGKLAQIIPDAVTFPSLGPRQFGQHKCLWFESASNLPALKESGWIDFLTHQGIDFTVCSNKAFVYPNVSFIPWSVGAVENIIGNYDTVILPVSKKPSAQYRSMNTAVDSIIAGCHVITDSRKVYGELKPYITITKDLYKTSLGGRGTKEETIKKISAGQSYIKQKFSAGGITDLWVKVLKQVKDSNGE